MRIKGFFLLMLLFLCSIATYAQDFIVDGIYYNRINDSNVEVTYKSSGSYYGAITIPSEVTYNNKKYNVIAVGQEAFYKRRNSSSISSVTLPSSIIRIGKLAFCGMTSLKTVNIPDAVKVIEYNAFDGCTGLTSIVLPGTLKSIGDYAFRECTGLTEIVVPASVKRAGSQVFFGCTGLTKVTYSAHVKNGGDYMFYGCSNLTSVTITPGITNIGYSMFLNCTSLTSINLPNGIKSIGSSAFSGCTNLSSITIPDGIEKISSDTFANTAWYNNQPDGLVYIGKYLYAYKGIMPENSSIEIKDGTVLIADNCFSSSYRYLSSVTIPNSVKYIGISAFSNCTLLSKVILPETEVTIGTGAFSGCRNLGNIENIESIIKIGSIDGFNDTPWFRTWREEQPDGELYLGKCLVGYKGEMPSDYILRIKEGTICVSTPGYGEPNSFYGLSNLKGIEFPSSLKYFGGNFASTGITSLVLPASVEEWGYFSYCKDLVSVEFPSNMEETPASMFQDCTALKNVTIPQSVTKIGKSTFSGCTALGPVFTIPEQLEEIGNQAFLNCSGIKVVINKSLLRITDSYGELGSIAEYVAYSDNQVTSYSGFLFAKDSDGVHLIGASTPKKDYVLPDTYVDGSSYDIVANAFAYDDTMESIQIGKGVTAIGNSAFTGTSKLKEVKFNATQCASIASYLSYNEYPFYNAGDAQSGYYVTFGANVKSVPNYCFYYGTNLKSVSFGNSVSSIGESSFARSGLTSIEIPSQITSIGSGAFGRTENLQEVHYSAEACKLPNNSTIFASAGEKTEEGFSVIIEDDVKDIPANLFNSGKIKSVSIGKGVKTIGSGAFSSSEYIKEILFNAKECTSASSLFGNNIGYKVSSISIIISDDVVSIPKGIFSGISNYTWARPISITIGENVTSIGTDAFANCYGLTKLNYKAINCAGFSGSDDSYSSGGRHPFYYAGDKSGGVDIVIGNKVKTIPAYFLSSHEVVKSLTIEGEIETIGDCAFCTYEKTGRDCFIPTEPFKKVKHIAYEAFRGCKNLGDISNFENIESIGWRAFYGCTSLTDIDFFQNVSSIDAFAFDETGWHNSQPDGVVYLWNKVYGVKGEFENGSEIVVKEGTEEIMPYAFSRVYGVSSVKLPSTLKKIGYDAFLYFDQLSTITVPSSIEYIENSAFARCSNLEEVKILAPELKEYGDWFIDDCSNNCKIYVPNASVDTYKEGFRRYADKVVALNRTHEIAFDDAEYNTCFLNYPVVITEGVEAYIATSVVNGVLQTEKITGIIPENTALLVKSCSNTVTLQESDTRNSIEGNNILQGYTVDKELDSDDVYYYHLAKGNKGIGFYKVEGSPFNYVAGSTFLSYPKSEDKSFISLKPNYFEMRTASGSIGKTITLPVAMKNELANINGFQCDIVVPEGFSVAKNEKGKYLLSLTERGDDHSFSTLDRGNNTVRVVCTSLTNASFAGTEGDLFEISLTSSEGMEAGEYKIKLENISLSNTLSQDIPVLDCEGIVTLKSFTPGDVNNDEKISVADVTAAISFVLGNESPAFIKEAADMDGSNEVKVNDVTAIISLVLNNNASSAKSMSKMMAKRKAGATDDPKLYIEQFSIAPGEEKYIDLMLDNPDLESIGWQADVELPAGLSFVTNDKGTFVTKINEARTDGYSVSSLKVKGNDNAVRFIGVSMENNSIVDESGVIMSILVKADENLADGDYIGSVTSASLSDVQSNDVPVADSHFTATVATEEIEYAEGYALDIAPFEFNEDIEIPVLLDNADDITNIEFDLMLPQAFIDSELYYVDAKLAKTKFTTNIGDINGGVHVAIARRSSNKIAAGEDTEVSVLGLVFEDVNEGLYTVEAKNIIATTSDGDEVKVAPYKASILVGNPSLAGDVTLYGKYTSSENAIIEKVTVNDDANVTVENVILSDDVCFNTSNDFVAEYVTYTATVSASLGYKTLVLPYNSAVPAGFEAYEVGSLTGNTLNMVQVQTITADKPVILKNAGTTALTAENVTVNATSGSSLANGMLVGTYSEMLAPVGSYVLQNIGGNVAFYPVAAGQQPTVGAFRAYLSTGASQAKSLKMNFDSVPTGIDAVEADTDVMTYNINGQRISDNSKGLRIVRSASGVSKRIK